MTEALAVAVGAAAGALLRWQAGVWLNARHAQLPLGTLLVNVVGGLLIGMALVALARPEQQLWRLLLVTGFLGGLTTFSAFSAESGPPSSSGVTSPAEIKNRAASSIDILSGITSFSATYMM